jgi:hypothetical protein
VPPARWRRLPLNTQGNCYSQGSVAKKHHSAVVRLLDHVTLGEAANHLTVELQEPVGELDVLRLALAGRLRLALYVPAASEVRCGERFERHTHISGLCELPHPLKGLARFEVERRYQWLRDRRRIQPPGDVRAACEDRFGGERIVSVKAADGIEVVQSGKSYLFEWDSSRQSALPRDSCFVLTVAAIANFESSVEAQTAQIRRDEDRARQRPSRKQEKVVDRSVEREKQVRALAISLGIEHGLDLMPVSRDASSWTLVNDLLVNTVLWSTMASAADEAKRRPATAKAGKSLRAILQHVQRQSETR